MARITRPIAFATMLLCAGLAAAPANAQLSRTYVSAVTGNDANNCDRPTPCRSFQGAHDKTNDQGEIMVLDPGGYGAVTITKSISIVNDGVGEASILVSGGATGITVNGSSTAAVNLRGLTVQGIGFGGGTGLSFRSGLSLTILDCVFRNHTGDGISFFPSNDGLSNLSIANTLVADNGNMGIGIALGSSVGTIRAVLDHVQTVNNSLDGILVDGAVTQVGAPGTINVTVTDSVSANNGREGFSVFSVTEAAANMMVFRSVAANNGDAGLDAEDGTKATLWVSQSVIAGNAHAWFAAGGAVLRSFGDNYIVGNRDGDPVPPTIARK
jgi:hypothetical protein